MIAGRDTTSSGLKWFPWLVSTHPEVERKIRDELLSAIPAEEAKKLRVFQIQELGKLVYLHAAMCESLRLFNPPVPFQHKEPLQAGILPGGHFVHSKLKVMFSLYAIWSQYGERIASNSSQKDGFPSMKTVAATIIHNFKVEVIEGNKISPNCSVILYMKHGLKVKIS
ncbi:alkane hydroxylase MAH1-like [Olea europaea subsp. europaea]|uniref:Alkane hydroxylase MAH1-like n=1 Tax=Olea europaea subsp. europaea TaxID=158383 RepID=A0A8S0SK39_OLEEU|nr:alkane hydroxylase MAH1-like [Olea europaea subsp. europaea]